ncbi:peptidoglycan D,D-transpeptidase FtsI family protein [Actinomyces urogenitalis]|uniref:peptidoglycan D,D-transpeptidase FtsI family protein n=1 Tax=Actinomyces urogenitalis TaxID=103621 RepID=UPI002431B9B1|nr:penicillin-binding protein 2 [Actinomyces urogenitalis]MCI7457488.1 penicillin-binding protein 2 [Actinomyces urogenitalis]
MNPSRRRALQLFGLAGFSVLTARTAWLQVVEGPALADKAKAERTITWVNRAERGQILGRDGAVLATSSISYDIGVNQVKIAQYEHKEDREDPATGRTVSTVVGYGAVAAAAQIAPILGVDPQELGAKMVGESTYVVIAEAVAPDTWRQIKALEIPGVEPDQRTRRSYPAGRVAGNVVGYTYEGKARELIGSAGLELTQNKALTGVDGRGSVEIGKTGAIIPTGEHDEVASVPGTAVRTTINPDLQAVAQEAIDEVVQAQGADWGSVVVMEPATGKLLVLADSRSVDPSDPGATAEEDRNARSVQAIFEPGSVGKVMTFAAALDKGVLTPEDQITVPYTWTAPNGQSFRDSHEHATQVLTAAQVLAESSNVGTVQIGDRVSDADRHAIIEQFGYGQLTGIEMPAESEGILGDYAQWDARTRYTTMFGQGIAGTSLQAVQVLASVANKGVRVAPRVIDAWIDAEGKETAQTQPEGVRVISEASATTLTEMLIGVTQEGGTAESASIDGYLVAGKTGTTEILTEPGTVASFVGFTPARDPAIAVAVIVYRPDGTYGGTVAAPVFRKIALACMHSLGIAPDPMVIAAKAAAEADAQAAKAAQDSQG